MHPNDPLHRQEKQALDQAITCMRNNQPEQAERIAREQLIETPSSLVLNQLLGHALLKQSRYKEAQAQIKLLINIAPDFAPAHEDMGSLLALQGKLEEAIPHFRRALQIKPDLELCRKKLTQALNALGRSQEADDSFMEQLDRSPILNNLAIAVEHWRSDRIDEAIPLFRDILRSEPDNVDALRFLALCYFDSGKNVSDAEALLRRAIQIAPNFTQGLHTLGSILHEQNKWADAVNIYLKLTELADEDSHAWLGLANSLSHEGKTTDAIAAYEKSLQIKHEAPGVHMAYAHMLKTVGKQQNALEEYRTAIQQKPELGEAYWSMANLKMFKFEDSELSNMEQQLLAGNLSEQSRVHFNFSLGKAYEDKKDFSKAWHHYDQGNQLQRLLVSYDPVDFELTIDRVKEVFSSEFIEKHKDAGNSDPAPIFIVGLPRTGSTLIEQILASHSQVEGTSELANIGGIASSTGKYRQDGIVYPETLLEANRRDWAAYGREYMEQTRHYRVLNKAYFIDKMPNNFLHIGWIKMILPNAKIINTRRYPIDSCLGAYKQLFAQGQNFTYDMLELAEYYKAYVDVMNHWHKVFPGEILDLHYEQTVDDLESQVHRVLDYCGLSFEESCLQYHQNARQVKTASSEQVRQPIYRSALNLSQKYGDALNMWHEELADVIEQLPPEIKQLVAK